MSDQAFFTDTYIRMMGAKDISAVYAIQQACYVPQMVEPEALIQQRWQQVADTSWVACDSAGPAAYLVAYRSLKNKVSALGEAFRHAECPDTLYLHDMAVHPPCAAAGLPDACWQVRMSTRVTMACPGWRWFPCRIR
jgi:hypothetical protein